MTDTAIRVEGIGKLYRVGERESYQHLRHVLANAFSGSRNGKRRPKDSIWAVRDVSFTVNQGEVVGLIGRNGAGKSTLLKLLARITRPTVGFADLHGRIGSLLEVGTGFHLELTGRENVFLSGAILGMKKAEIRRKFDEIVAFAEVERFLDSPLKHYSTGMHMRLAFAVAAHLEPEILLVDEVLAVGDAAFQKKCLGKMQDVSRAGRTIIFVSHNMAAVRSLCSRAAWLENGRLLEDGATEEVINRYLPRSDATSLEVTWHDESSAPGDDRVRLRNARIIPQVGFDGLITVHTPLQVEFSYWNYRPGVVLNVSMALYRLDDTCAFVSASDFMPRPAGLIRHTAEIPGDFLNAGSYYITLIIVEDASTGLLRKDRILVFDVVEGKPVGNWYGRIPGAVRPKLKWKSEAVGTADFPAPIAMEQDF